MNDSPKNSREMDRRHFFQQTGLKALGGAMSLGLAQKALGEDTPKTPPDAPPAQEPEKEKPKPETRNQVEGMSYIQLGRTNLMVSRLSLGGTPWNNNVARRAIAAGVNMVHGASQYGTMEEQQRGLNGLWDKIWYCLKLTEDDMGACIDKALKILQRNHVDVILAVVTRTDRTNYTKIKEDFAKTTPSRKSQTSGRNGTQSSRKHP